MLVRRADPALPRLENEGIPAAEIDLSGMPRTVGPALLGFPFKLLASLRIIRRILRDFRPDVVVGMGGYLTFPSILAAALRGTPRVIHDSNAILGLANRLCARLGADLYWGLPPAEGSGLVVGTPIRPALWKPLARDEAARRLGLDPAKTTVLVFGGSQGARGINKGAPEALKTAANAAPHKLQVLHLAGSKDEEAVHQAYAGAHLSLEVLPYLDQMEAAYGAADLVICRSGASTLAELAAQKKPAVLVPYPFAAANHQDANARVFERAGACKVMLEEDIQARLAPLLEDLLFSDKGAAELAAMSAAFAKLSLPPPERCAEDFADAVEKKANETKNTGLQR
jgi:UDP-N-acetylglucosamine--N-acetylmuramyl-(pentapeptide) pyrophosphoryl-undecaprenol N-acetylglucosamine transferase